MLPSKITIKDVAKKAGVSIATVSRFLNKSPSLKEENRRRIELAIKELNYQPSIYARRLAGGHLNTFALIIPGYEGIFYSFYAMEIMREVAAALSERGIDLHLHIFWGKDNFKTSLVDGAIIADVIDNGKQVKRLIEEDLPCIVINRKMDEKGVSYVAIDNFKGAYEATEFLIHHGHKNIMHLAGDLRVQGAKERLEGYKQALKKNGIKYRDEYVKITNFSRREVKGALEPLFGSKKDKPTAIFCCSDEIASEVLNFAEEQRLEVPRELSIIGFDDNPHCMYGDLMLTTVRQPLKTMVSKAVNILQENIQKDTPPQRVVLQPELIIRDTVSFL
ncbi:MAG: LacI family DNA-binding transcriptional regulator [Candidatus Omnitrophica bacterium]|nr:LacI family DNA-binding transcriptional regulator [Candidatus Omnitrophota bacterium]MBD3269599.1 LacI family DNA-binding transcriptional regulator [Candidatus Omnitrophota bacterium]